MTQQEQDPNQFELSGDGVQISYQSSHFIDMPNLPQFTYQDDQLNLTFNGEQIRAQSSELGTLVSVTLIPSIDAGATVLTLLLPSIKVPGLLTEKYFETLGIISKTFGILPHDGADAVYKNVLNLQGSARLVPLA